MSEDLPRAVAAVVTAGRAHDLVLLGGLACDLEL